MKVLVIQGAGMNMRGKVDVEIFGPMTLEQLNDTIRGYAANLGIDVEFCQSNIEGEVVNALYDAHDRDVDAALINPAGYMRTTGPLPTAIGQVRFPVIEVHVSNQKAGEAWQDYDLAFFSAMGTPLDGTNVYHAFKRLLKQAGLPLSCRVHDLRHSTATYLLVGGVDPRIVMQIMGWSQVSMLKRYQHVLPAMLDDAAARLESVLPDVRSAS
jgi:3-dehydroquinate dehydratase-2